MLNYSLLVFLRLAPNMDLGTNRLKKNSTISESLIMKYQLCTSASLGSVDFILFNHNPQW